MHHLKVKICGITRPSDAMAAVEAGADALGFMFYEPSPRHVTPRAAAEIIRELPPFIAKVGVFVNAGKEDVERAVATCGLDTLQFHGEESPKYCAGFALKVIKAFRVRGTEVLEEGKAYHHAAWLLDSYVPGQLGGTGATFNWTVARAAVELGRCIILAGGLTTANIGAAVEQVRPYAVDVSSGVESEPGRKDSRKMREFIAAARRPSSPPPI